MTNKSIVHLICNAHIDPVWKWPWEEDAREAVSTFHTAAGYFRLSALRSQDAGG